jgi:hypothetical protein
MFAITVMLVLRILVDPVLYEHEPARIILVHE